VKFFRNDIEKLVSTFEKASSSNGYYEKDVLKAKSTQRILNLKPEQQIKAIHHLLDRNCRRIGKQSWSYKSEVLIKALFRRALPFSDKDFNKLLSALKRNKRGICSYNPSLRLVIRAIGRVYKDKELPTPIVSSLCLIFDRIKRESGRDAFRLRMELSDLLGVEGDFPVEKGEAWSDAAIETIRQMEGDAYDHWVRLIAHCLATTGSKPSKKWQRYADECVEAIGHDSFLSCVEKWLVLIDKPRTTPLDRGYYGVEFWDQMIIEPHQYILKGLIWCCCKFSGKEVARTLTQTALSAYRKLPERGPRLIGIGNACVYALGQIKGMDAVGQLAILQAKAKFAAAQKMIDKALNTAAEREGLPRDEIDELAVPEYGLTDVGKRVEVLGDYQAEFIIADTRSSELRWIKADGKRQKSIPKAVKENFAEELKGLKAGAKDIQKMLGAQRDRIDQLHLKQKMWSYAIWRQRYLDHPLVGVLARRLIWEIETRGRKSALICLDGGMVDVEGNAVEGIEDSATVALWHPIGKSSEEVLGWRSFLEEHQIKQPFKQAHREIYLLTDAEQTTGVYSNRFGAHILKQHQFAALCKVRGWHYGLMGQFDSHNTPFKKLEDQGITVEFWIDPIVDVETSEMGIDLYVATDQIRFVGADGQPLALQDVPALVFSEVMRDVDLFVGVCSVGNDPNWADGGPDGRYRDYWHSYSFGDLSESAKTRKAVLENLIPRLKISERCGFEEKYLVVRGDIRTYKIHLGSGNILMEPNDQYLCIVPGRSTANVGGGKVFLPFEGDNTLSIILSKALLLAEDKKIKDATILSQIKK
jgi:hypothetical protein